MASATLQINYNVFPFGPGIYQTNMTCGLDGLVSSSTIVRSSAAISGISFPTAEPPGNVGNPAQIAYVDVQVMLRIKTLAGVPATDPKILVYVYSFSAYNTPTPSTKRYADNITINGTFTLPDPTNLKLVQTIEYNVTTPGTDTQYSSPFSIGQAFGGIIPYEWGIVVSNQTGLTLSGIAGGQTDNTASYIGINLQTTTTC